MLFSLIVGLILAIFNYIYHTFITPDTIDFFVSEAQKASALHHKTPAETEQYVEIQKDSLSSYRLLPPTLFVGPYMGYNYRNFKLTQTGSFNGTQEIILEDIGLGLHLGLGF